MISYKHLNNPIKIIYYINPKKAFKKLYNYLSKSGSVLVLGRNNFDIYKFCNTNKDYMTIHSAKGLESDNVIIINLTDGLYGFPNKKTDNNLKIIVNNPIDDYLYSEERRLFYVALTRTRNYVYLLTPLFKRSIFVKEIKKIIKKSDK